MSRQTISFEDSSSSRVADFPSRFSSAKDLATTSSASGASAEEEEEKERKEKEERGFLGRRERLRNMRPEKNFPVLRVLRSSSREKMSSFLFRVCLKP